MKNIKKIAPYFITIGIFIGLFTALIPFLDVFSNKWENRIYFRGILLGFLFVSFSAALIKNHYMQNIVISLGSGIISLLFISTLNLLIDNSETDLIKTELYFIATYWVIGVVFVILTMVRLWLNKVLKFIGF